MVDDIATSVLFQKALELGWTRDPFDRLLVAQSQIERMPLVTSDAVLGRYDVETIW